MLSVYVGDLICYISEVFLGTIWMVLGVMLVEIVAIEATYEALFLYAYDHILEIEAIWDLGK